MCDLKEREKGIRKVKHEWEREKGLTDKCNETKANSYTKFNTIFLLSSVGFAFSRGQRP
jgi:hypothetical protein